jgi:hypothetical protein
MTAPDDIQFSAQSRSSTARREYRGVASSRARGYSGQGAPASAHVCMAAMTSARGIDRLIAAVKAYAAKQGWT